MSDMTYIAKDAYAGKHVARKNASVVKADRYSAGELAAMFGAGKTFVIWESFGHIRPGVEGFKRTRFIADAEGNLHGYDADGARKIIHPAARSLRILTK